MIDEEIVELINREIDGEIDSRESARLREILAENADARLLHEQLVRLDTALGDLEAVEPPPEIRNSTVSSASRFLANSSAASAPAKLPPVG